MSFSQPAQGGQGGDNFEAKEHRGHLLLVYPKVYHPEVQTKNGPSTAADVDIIIVDKYGPDGKPLAFTNARLFGNLANSVRNNVGTGQGVLGRLDQIQTQGGRTPWVLQNYTDADVAAADPVEAAYKAGLFRQPSNPMQTPAPQAAPAYAPQATPTAPPQQQWNAQPPAAPPAAPAQAWSAPAASTPPAAPATGSWQQPPAAAAPTPAPPAAPATPAAAPPAAAPAAADPGLVQALAQRGINLPPGTSHEDALNVWNSLG